MVTWRTLVVLMLIAVVCFTVALLAAVGAVDGVNFRAWADGGLLVQALALAASWMPRG